jgi:hypothetical protein
MVSMKPMISGCGGRVPRRRSRCSLEDRVVLLQPANLRLQRLDFRRLPGRLTFARPGVDLGLQHPPAHALLGDTDLLGHRLRRDRQRRVLRQMLIDQPDSAGHGPRDRSSSAWCTSFQLRKMRHQTWVASARRTDVQPTSNIDNWLLIPATDREAMAVPLPVTGCAAAAAHTDYSIWVVQSSLESRDVLATGAFRGLTAAPLIGARPESATRPAAELSTESS